MQNSQFETHFIAVRTERVPASITLDFNTGDGIPSWHFNDDAEMLNPALWNMGQLFQNAGKDRAARRPRSSMATTCSVTTVPFKNLSFGVRYDDREAVHRQPVTTPAPFLPAPLVGHMPKAWSGTQRQLL